MTDNPLFQDGEDSLGEENIDVEEGSISEEEVEHDPRVGILIPMEGEYGEYYGEEEEGEYGEYEEEEGEGEYEDLDLDNILNEELKKKIDEDSDVEEYITETVLEDPKDIFADVTTEDLDLNIEAKYANALDGNDIERESVYIEDIDQDRIELLKAFRDEESLEEQGIQSMSKVRAVDRQKKENRIKKSVRRVQRKLRHQFLEREKKRRKRYKEMSEIARTHFRAYEDRLRLNLEIKGAVLETSKKSIDVHQRQWKLRWDREPNQLDIRLCQLRSVGEKLQKGEYVMLISLYDRIGGRPIKYRKHGTKTKRASEPVYHGGQFRDVNMIFDQLIRITSVSKRDLSYRMVIVFELLFMKVGRGENSKVVNETIGWGVFPLVDCNKNFVQGCFKVPFIKGELDTSVQKYSTIENILKNSLEYWLGNFYFETKYGEVDHDIVPREEYIIEIVHDEVESSESDETEEEEGMYDDDDLLMMQDVRKIGGDEMGSEELGDGYDDMMMVTPAGTNEDQLAMLKEMEEKYGGDNSGSSSEGGGEEEVLIREGRNDDDDDDDEYDDEISEDYSEEMVTPRDHMWKVESAVGLSKDPLYGLNEDQKREKRRKKYEEEVKIDEKETDGREIGIFTGNELKQKKADIETITAENPRIWFGKPRFGYIREKDDWNEDHDVEFDNDDEEEEGEGEEGEGEGEGEGEEGKEKKKKEKKEKEEGKKGQKDDRLLVPKRTKEKVIVTKRGKEVPVIEMEKFSDQKKRDRFISPFSQKAKKKRAKERAKSAHQQKTISRDMSSLSLLTGTSHSMRRISSSVLGTGSVLDSVILDEEKPVSYPYNYVDNFVYRRDKFGVTRDRGRGEKSERDVEKISHSFFDKPFPEHGLTKTELVMYKQSVRRKQYSWQKTPIYLEKLRFIWRTTSMDLGMDSCRKFQFYFMVMILLGVIFVRAYPHYLGQWLWLSLFSIPYHTPFGYFFYLKFTYRTQFQTTAFNFTYSAVGTVSNLAFSAFMILVTWIAQKLFKNLPILYYRLVLFYIFAVVFDSLLMLIPDLITGLNYPEYSPYGDNFVLMDYYKQTEGSDLPGILLTIGLNIVLVCVQLFLLYHYVTYVHMNRRVLDLYKRLYKPERKFYIPHDLEVPRGKLLETIDQAKKYVGSRGRIMKVVTKYLPMNLRDAVLLRRLKDLLNSKDWPHDYIQNCLEKEAEYFREGMSISIPRDLLDQKRSGAALHKKTTLGKVFIVNKFSFLANALYFDEIKNTTQQQRQNQLLNLFRKYRMIVPNMIERLRKDKAVQCVFMKSNLCYCDVDVINDEEFEVDGPTLSELRKEVKISHWKRAMDLFTCCFCCWCCCCRCLLWRCFCRICGRRFSICGLGYNFCGSCNTNNCLKKLKRIRFRRNVVAPVPTENFDGSSAVPTVAVQDWELEDLTTTVVDQDEPEKMNRALHIVIYCQEKGRLHVRRNFVQTPRGYICEVFSRKQNQLSVSNVGLPNSTDYWVDRAFEETRREERRRRKVRRRKRRARNLLKSPMIMMKFKNIFEKRREKRSTNLLDKLKKRIAADDEKKKKKKREEEEEEEEEEEGLSDSDDDEDDEEVEGDE